jgi:hypothetical protein
MHGLWSGGRREMHGERGGARRRWRRWVAGGLGLAPAPALGLAPVAALGLAQVAELGLMLALASVAALGLAVGACRPAAEEIADGEDPLAALAAPAGSARYDGPYWAREAHRRSRTWEAAKAFCARARAARLPNCHAVELVERWENVGTPAALPALPVLPALPALPPPPPLPPALHPGDPGRAAADLAAVRAWEEGLAARGREAAATRSER